MPPLTLGLPRGGGQFDLSRVNVICFGGKTHFYVPAFSVAGTILVVIPIQEKLFFYPQRFFLKKIGNALRQQNFENFEKTKIHPKSAKNVLIPIFL